MRILVTGATGLLGSALLPILRAQGHRVRALVRFTSHTDLVDLRDVEIVQGNILEPDSLPDAISGVDVIVHAAASILGRDEEAMRRINVDGTDSLLAATRKVQGPPPRFVYVSSIAAGGQGTATHPLTEEMAPRPASHYGRTKLEAEELVREHGRRRPAAILRLCTLYGPRDRFFPMLYRLIDMGFTPVPGDGEMQMSFLHADDAARAVACAVLTADLSGQSAWYVASASSVTFNQFCDAIQKALGRRSSLHLPIRSGLLSRAESLLDRIGSLPGGLGDRIPQEICPDMLRLLASSGLVCDGSAFARVAGFSPATTLEHGLTSTIRWYRQNDLL